MKLKRLFYPAGRSVLLILPLLMAAAGLLALGATLYFCPELRTWFQ